MTRYFSSFVITILLYSCAFAAIYFSFNEFKVHKNKVNEKRVSLDFVTIKKEVKEIKQVKELKKELKKEIKEVKKTKVEKKKEIKKKIVKKRVVEKQIPKKKKQFIKTEEKQIKKIIKTQESNKAIKKVSENKNVVNENKKSYEEIFLHKNLLTIQKQIQKCVRYSSRAKRLNIQGEVLVQFKLTKSGIEGDIVTLSGHRLLRKSTIKAINEASLYFPKVSKDITIKLPVVYKLI